MPIEEDISKLYETYFTHTSGGLFPQSNASAFREYVGKAILASAFGYKKQSPDGWAALVGYLGMRSRFLRERVGSTVSWLDGSERGRLIDVGCGNGEFLARMQELGWDVVGVEPDPRAAGIGREKYGLKIYSEILGTADFPPESLDVATLIHVIEHLTDPVSTLKAAKSLLKKGGRLVIHTPNVFSLGHRWFRQDWRGLEPPRHIFLFSPEALRKVAEMAGFEVVDFRNNSVFADFFWTASSACKEGLNPNSISDGYAGLIGHLFMALEHIVTGWPFYRVWGEQLVLVAVKN
jgi:SAM-dependent methyltransferase